MSGVGGIIYDKDAVYIDIGQKGAANKQNDDQNDEVSFFSTKIFFSSGESSTF